MYETRFGIRLSEKDATHKAAYLLGIYEAVYKSAEVVEPHLKTYKIEHEND